MIILSLKQLSTMLSMMLLVRQPNHSLQDNINNRAVGDRTTNAIAKHTTYPAYTSDVYGQKAYKRLEPENEEINYNGYLQFIQTHVDPNFQGNAEHKASYLAITNSDASALASVPYPEPIQEKSDRQRKETLCLLESEGIDICIEFNLADNTKLEQVQQAIKEATRHHINRYNAPPIDQKYQCRFTEWLHPNNGKAGLYHTYAERAKISYCNLYAVLDQNQVHTIKHEVSHLLDDFYTNGRVTQSHYSVAGLFREGHAQYMSLEENRLDGYLIEIQHKLHAVSDLSTANPLIHKEHFKKLLNLSDNDFNYILGPVVTKYIDKNYSSIAGYMTCLRKTADSDSPCAIEDDKGRQACHQNYVTDKNSTAYGQCTKNSYNARQECMLNAPSQCFQDYINNNFNMEEFTRWCDHEIDLRTEVLNLDCNHTTQLCTLGGNLESTKPVVHLIVDDNGQGAIQRYSCTDQAKTWLLDRKAESKDGKLAIELVAKSIPNICMPMEEASMPIPIPILGTRTILGLGAAVAGLSGLGASMVVKKPKFYRRLRGF